MVFINCCMYNSTDAQQINFEMDFDMHLDMTENQLFLRVLRLGMLPNTSPHGTILLQTSPEVLCATSSLDIHLDEKWVYFEMVLNFILL